MLGTRSTFVLLREAFYGCTRFDDFVRRAQISEPVAALRLRGLVEHGLLAREPYRDAGQRGRREYRLTEKGTEAFPILAALLQWGNRWVRDDGGRVQLRHRGCGASVSALLQCTEGHELSPGELELAPAEAARASDG